MTALEQVKAFEKAELAAGRQVHWDIAFAASYGLTKKMIYDWYPDAPGDLKKAELIEWLAQRALAHTRTPAE